VQPCLKNGSSGERMPVQAATHDQNAKYSSHFRRPEAGQGEDFLPQSLGAGQIVAIRRPGARGQKAPTPPSVRSGMSFAPYPALSWWLGFRIGFDGWSKSCRLSRRNLRGARRDKIPGDLSGQELACLWWSVPIPRFVNLEWSWR
jgi:hypothetical protein